MPLTTFLTATGFLAAILLVWAQSWLNIYETPCVTATVAIGLIWTYLAVVLAMAAFALAGWRWSEEKPKNFQVTGLPFGLLVSVLIMAIIDVGQSLFFTAIKFVRGLPFHKPMPELETILQTYPLYSIIFVVLIAVFIILMSWWGAKKREAWIVEIGALVIGTVVLAIIYL